MLLAIYLNDHLAGATSMRELARRAAAENRGNALGGALVSIAAEIEEDRETLVDLMRKLEIGRDRMKVVGGWAAERLGRLKLNGRLRGYSPLSRLEEIEALTLGVHGKLALWRALERIASAEPRLLSADLTALVERARGQLETLEAQRLPAAEQALLA